MTKITVSADLLATDLSKIPTVQSGLDFISHVKSEIVSLLAEDAAFDTPVKKSGSVYTVSNPKYTGADTAYSFTGHQSLTLNSSGQATSIASEFSGYTAVGLAGKYTAKGQFSSSVTETGGVSYSLKYTNISFKGYDGSTWALKGNFSTEYRLNKATGEILNTRSEGYVSFDAKGLDTLQTPSVVNLVSSSGNILGTATSTTSTSPSITDYAGNFTALSLKSGTSSLAATDLTMSKTNVASGFGFGAAKVTDVISVFLAGDDVLTLASNSLPKMATTQTITGTYASLVYAYAGNDKVTGTRADDFLCGGEWDATASDFKSGSGKDSLYGGLGSDSLYGADDADLLDGGAGTDWLWGGAGNDTLLGGAGDDLIYGQSENDSCIGGAGKDFIDGGAGNDFLDGGAGDDTLAGGAGNDSILGGSGDDAIAGGGGADTLTGGAGRDIFSFLVSEMSSTDVPVITDFQVKADLIRIRTTDATAYAAVTQVNFSSGAGLVAATTATQIYLYDTTTGTLYYDADGTGATAIVPVCVLTGAPSITYHQVLSLLVT
ncbi:MAG: hypothetical protein RIR18_580 [Pseudomonadota bacterium]|jgi:Ca2+-binding RTX toxin-like protein